MSPSTTACDRFFSIPELRLSLSDHVETKADVSKLARVDRLSYSLLVPLLFTEIDVRLRDIVAIAKLIKTHPELAYRCTSLRVRSPDFEDARSCEKGRREAFKAKCVELASVLQALSTHGRLATFEWLWEPGWLDDDEVPGCVWAALKKNAPSLQKVDIALSKADGASLSSFASDSYGRLRSFRVDLSNAHSWDGARLHSMLCDAPQLESLTLILPTCCGPQDLALSSTHPKLRTFFFQGSVLSGAQSEGEPLTRDFLKRHPAIEYLDLCCQTNFDVDDKDLPSLRALSVEHCTLSVVNLFSDVAQRPIKALRLVRMPHLTMSTVFNLCASVAPTMKYLHMESSIFSFRANLEGFSDLLRSLPGLTELRLGAESVCAFQLQHRLCEQDLVDFLKTLSDECAPALTAISFADSRGRLLTERCIADLPIVPSSLRRIAWDVCGTRYLYEITNQDAQKSHAVLLSSSSRIPRQPWVDESVLDHFGGERQHWQI